MQVTKGTHTLKLTRDGLPPRLIRLRLETSEAFPRDWKPVEREVKISRIPPGYCTVFLTPGNVNIATLRLAIENTITDYGPQYAKGPHSCPSWAEGQECTSDG